MQSLPANIAKFEIFKGLATEDLEALAKIAEERSFPHGKLIFQQSDVGGEVYLIMQGRVDILLNLGAPGDNREIATLKEGDLFGELVLLGEVRRSASAKAKENLKVLVWPADALAKLHATHQAIGYQFMKSVAAALAFRLTATNMLLRNTLKSLA